ncbi:Glycine-rich RNA-binding protein mitochondrial-like [Quillaja saponaria]|uniref:Glycine-rich RNA-binding protein mitochondrial-like n=1 Tax=Quillaja saponaria TaxID=32244 RepID=A0AAD7LN38_QUISA|nr:Glycine-rich RNA-binding protein mitochondrial-like [Quillaja saponaria]
MGKVLDNQTLKSPLAKYSYEFVGLIIVYDKDSGRSRGFRFVIFSNEDDAKCAKDAMDGKVLLGRPLRINFAFEKVRGGPVVVPRLSNLGNSINH